MPGAIGEAALCLRENEREALLQFIEHNLDKAPLDMDEGMGTVYERAVFACYFRRLQETCGLRTVLECPADGVTGVPGINSLEFARNGAEIWLANPSQRMLDAARAVWERQGLAEHVRFAQCEVDATPFEDDTFDLVWNYCMFERFREPAALVAEMKRVSRKYVFIMTQNVHGLGTPFHKFYHRACEREWDHGHESQMTFAAIRTALRQQALQIESEGALDIPPWLDTWDMPLGIALRQLAGLVGKKWEWKAGSWDTGRDEARSRSVTFVSRLEAGLPGWFRRSQAHHLYVLARK